MKKGLVTRIGEAIDQHRQDRSALAVQPSEDVDRSRLPGMVRWFLPNGGTLLLIAILIFTQNVWAGSALRNLAAESATSTGTIAYQGRLADSGGNPLTDTLNMSFRLFSAATGGAALWTEQWTGSNGVQVSDGLFNVMLGSLTPIAQSVITGNSTLFLGITVGTDGEMSPRVQLGSVPFAVQALSVPNGSISTAKVADGAITQQKLADDVNLTIDAKVLTWEKADDISFAAASYARQTTQETSIQVQVPANETHIYLIIYETDLGYLPGESTGTSFYGAWNADLLANDQPLGQRVLITTGYRYLWSAVGSSYWWQRPSAIWTVEIGSGTHTLKLGINGYSDGTMNTAHIRNQMVQAIRLH